MTLTPSPQEPAAPPPRGTAVPFVEGGPSLGHELLGRLRALFQPEDLVLAVWLLLLGPALMVAAGGEHPFQLGTVAAPVGWFYALACLGGIVCMVTRGRGETLRRGENGEALRIYALFPMATALAIVGFLATESTGFGMGELLPLLAFGAAVVGFIAQPILPAVTPALRRAFIMPFILVGTGIFESMLADTWGDVPLADLVPTYDAIEPGYASLMLSILVVVSLFIYYLFVFAPRVVAGVGGSIRTWALRFVLFAASLVLGVSWLRFIV
jgi:hypothetical protein